MRYKTASVYSIVAYFNQACNVLINLFFIKSLSLSVLGDIALAKVWMQLIDYSHLGLRFALDRYVPVWSKTESTGLLKLCIVVSTLVSMVMACFALLVSTNVILVGVFILSGYCVSISTIIKNYYRASFENKKMLYMYILSPTIPIAVQLLGLYFFGFYLYLWMVAITSIIVIVYLVRKINIIDFSIKQNLKPVLHEVGSSAVYLFLTSLVMFASFSVDRMMLNYFEGKEILGEYSVIMFGFSLLLIVPSTLAEFVFPRIISEVVKSGRVFFLNEVLSIIIPTVFFVGIAYYFGPYFIEKFTTYSHLKNEFKFAVIGVIPYAVTPVLYHTMSALDMRGHLLSASFFVLIFYICILGFGGITSNNLLNYFINARVAYGYMLLSIYGGVIFYSRSNKWHQK